MTATLTRTVRRAAEVPAGGSGLGAADDRDLVARVAGGDRDALGELYRRHRGLVTGYVRNRIGVVGDAEDVVHDAFLHAWDTASQYDPGAGYTVRAWLCGRAGQALRQHSWNELHPYRAAVDASREAARRPVTETAEAREARPVSAPVAAALATLTEPERRAVQAYYLDGLSGEQAAEAAGVTVATLRGATFTARRKLARALADRAPAARSALQEMPAREAVRQALAAVGADNVPAAEGWLAERGVRASRSALYRAARREKAHTADTAVTDAAPLDYTAPEEVLALARPMQRARAAALDYRQHHGRLPNMSELADAAQINYGTAGAALRDVRAGRTGRYYRDPDRAPDRARAVKPAPPAYTAPEQIRSMPPTDRARAAGRDYRTQHEQLPSIRRLVAATGVSRATAARALRELRTETAPGTATIHDQASQASPASGDQSRRNDRPAATADARTATATGTGQPQTSVRATALPRQDREPGRDRERHGRAHDSELQGVERPTVTPASQPADQRHRVRVHSQAAHSTRQGQAATRYEDTSVGSAAGREDGHEPADREQDASRPPPAEVSIARARVALAVLKARRAEQDTRRTADRARAEQLARWHHDEHHNPDTRARSRATDGEGHTR